MTSTIDWTRPIISKGNRPARWLGTLKGNRVPHVVAFELHEGTELLMQCDAYGRADMGNGCDAAPVLVWNVSGHGEPARTDNQERTEREFISDGGTERLRVHVTIEATPALVADEAAFAQVITRELRRDMLQGKNVLVILRDRPCSG